ncbi:GNAT family N-acetyltransferase [Janthinobacterium aquaticum]|uniref:GNAT family N-acetyltransferase n=1 Tax=Janthinobacterium sp. FT58W TaxID=2654254 RepID=UPI00126484A1|nr:GNAT family N-acetyltransferase [Janthinobacterium sp. FT58W]KAB8036635.1 GNAT family N-acetyltransferase [Janthinobacterium sp. FT58W]
MISPLHYLPAHPEDAAAFVALRGQTRQNAISAERLAELGITAASWADMMENGNLSGVTCDHEGELVGYCFGDLETGEVIVLALLPAYEGQGIGRKLLELVVKQLHAKGHQTLFLGCSNDPESRSYGFYRHLGWRATGAIDKYGDEVLEYRF